MLRRTRIALATPVATLVLCAAVGSATARRFELSSTTFRITWPELHAEFVYLETNQRMSIKCPVTVEGSFHSRTLSKVSGSLIGYVMRESVNEAACIAKSLTLEFEGIREAPSSAKLQLLPEAWHIRYTSFSGILPTITQIRVLFSGFALRAYELTLGTCLYRSTAASPVAWLFDLNAEHAVTRIKAEEAGPFTPFSEGSFFCGERVLVEGAGTVTQQGIARAITMRLVA
jgi:hypothetical protein